MLARLVISLLILLQAVPPYALCPVIAPCPEEPAPACMPEPVTSCCMASLACPRTPEKPAPAPQRTPDPQDCCLLGPCAPGPTLPGPPPEQPAKLARLPYAAILPPARLVAHNPRASAVDHAVPSGRLRPTLCIWVI